jgi:hypothetical protein
MLFAINQNSYRIGEEWHDGWHDEDCSGAACGDDASVSGALCRDACRMGSPALERRGGSCARPAPVGIYPTVSLLHSFYAAARVAGDALVMCFACVTFVACIMQWCPRSCRPP